MTATALIERRHVPGVQDVRDPAVVAALESAWNRLVEDADDQVFYRHEFVATWLAHFAPEAQRRVILGRDAREGLTAVLPLVAERTTLAGIPVRMLTSASNVHSCRFDLVARDPVRDATAILDHLLRTRDWDVLRLVDVPERGAAWQLAAAARARGLTVATWESVDSPYVPLPASADDLAERLDARFRANLRRRRRRLAEKGRVDVEHVTGGRALDERLAEGFALEQSGWKGRRGTAIAQDAAVRGFYTALAHAAAARGHLSLYFLRIDGRAIAFHYALEYGGRYLLLKPAYDEAFREVSPGQLLTWDVLRACIDRRLDEFDFLGPDMPWKRDWARVVRRHRWLYVFRPTIAGRLAHATKFRWLPAARQLVQRLRRA
jgi:CelD/BcsL family acetyltransferase involved in cellulose biosynthesis